MSRSRPVIAAIAMVAACSGTGDPTPTGLEREVVVSAAASLGDAFAAVEEAFEAAHPGVDVILNLAASSALREQILEGAPVDVFASASPPIMDQVVAAGLTAGDPSFLALNRLAIAVPPGNPAGIVGLDDFGRADLVVGLCAEEAPCGALARQALDGAGVRPEIDTNEPNVRSLLTKIELGEVDAGIVYATDVASGRVDGVPIPAEHNRWAVYPIAVLADAPHPVAAGAFVGFVLSEEGQAILAEHGFEDAWPG